MSGRLLAGLALALAVLAGVLLAGQVLSGAQPWGPLLTDNMVFAKSIPFTLGLGIAFGVLRGARRRTSGPERRTTDGALRRFAPGTVFLHWLMTAGVLLALVTGTWQYLKGVLDVDSPIFMPFVYRLHYLGATILLFVSASFVTYWLLRGDRALLPGRGQWIRHLRGLAHELPRPLGGLLAGMLGLNMRRQPPPTEQFTHYEKAVSFPLWLVALGLILVTGLLKAMRYAYPIPGELLAVASTIHVGATILLAAKLLDHLRYVMAPNRWPLMVSMVTSWMSERYARARHPEWLAESEAPAEESSKAAPPVGPAPSPGPGLQSAQGAR